ncbi:MAG: M28 family peptidase [Promethearchaeota archaeon]
MSPINNLIQNNSLYHLSESQAQTAHSQLEITNEDALRCLMYTDKTIKITGPRLAGTKSSHKAANLLHSEMEKFGENSFLEEFSVNPDSFLSFMPVMATSYLISSLFLLFGGYWVYLGVAGYIFGAIYAILQFVFYEKTFDPWYRSLKGYNTGTTIEPASDVRQQIIISGHHDSAFIFNFLEHHQKWYSIRIAGGLVIFAIALIFAIYWALFHTITGYSPPIANIIRFLIIGGSLGLIQYYFFKNRKGSPGAGDNLIASVMAMKIGQKFAATKKLQCNPLLHTRLIVLSNDAEECGLRGAAAYVAKHRNELTSMPTYVLNADSIYDLKDLQILISDINGTVKLSKSMAEEVQTISNQLGYSPKLFSMPFGAGGTDAAEFAKIGVEAITILALPTEYVRDNLVYHTSLDTVDKIEPAAVKAILEIMMEYIIRKDAETAI